jgi:hypothetical protein
MTKDEQLRLSLMLAFQTMIAQGESATTDAAAERIIDLAKLMDEFCDLHLTQSFPTATIKFVDDKGAAQIDATIDMHIEELRKRETTQLPTDRETLIQFYDRLQLRKMRRGLWMFYAQAPAERLADLVLDYMDEEIEEKKAGGYQ